ncbi:MAG: hypothetical protein H7X86_07485, partial [Gorillibacterium sp.]|nr:hypothetical protein [Gorillibacterium sp.]
MEVIDRYIYTVVQKLPQQQRAEIEMELRGLIEDMLEERVHGGGNPPEQVKEVLLELGDPRDLAAKYRGYQKYLISPELFYPYISVLKLVMFALFIAITVVYVVESI